MPSNLLVTPNHVYVDQVLSDIAATKAPRVFGQLVCPSKPRARELILGNYRALFEDMARAGVRVSGLTGIPYDFGGCRCEECEPWIPAYAELTREIHGIAEELHPGTRMDMVGWWWSERLLVMIL